MPVDIHRIGEIQPGDIYEDCAYHPCLCTGVGDENDPEQIWGISLVDGSYPRSCSVLHCGVRRLTPEEAWHWRIHGPPDVELAPEHRWWEQPGGSIVEPAV